MPLTTCSISGKPGYKWGDAGHCYTYEPNNERARKAAKAKAIKQGYAMGERNPMDLTLNNVQTRTARFEIDSQRANSIEGGIPVVVSTDAPVVMPDFGGPEVLVHSAAAVDLSRAPLPIIATHEEGQINVGVIEELQIAGGQLRGVARFGVRPEAKGYEADVRGGIIRSISVGYQRVKGRVVDDVLMITRWVPRHAAMVAEPADPGAGFFRNLSEIPPFELEADGHQASRDAKQSQPAASATTQRSPKMDTTQQAAAAVPAGDGARVTENYDAAAMEKLRADAIRKMAGNMDINDERAIQHWIVSGKDWNTVADEMTKVKAERSKAAAISVASIGLNEKQAGSFSIVRAINAVINKDWSKAGFEADCSRTVAAKVGKLMNEHTFAVPQEVQNLAARVLISGTAAQGGDLVKTDLISFIDILRNRSVAFQAGVTTMSGLVGQVAIPKKTTAGAFAWLAETGTATASEFVLAQVTMSPKRIAGYQEYSKMLMMQSTPDVETLVLGDLAGGLAVAVDAAILVGTGANTPLGVRYQTGLGTANPTSGTAVNYQDMIRFQTTVAAANALFPGFTYLTTPTVAGILMGKQRWGTGASDAAIWEGGLLNGSLVGQRAWSTVQIPSGVMLAGDFSQAIFGQWAGMEIEVNPYANFQADIVGVKATIYADVAVRYPGAFAVGTGMTG